MKSPKKILFATFILIAALAAVKLLYVPETQKKATIDTTPLQKPAVVSLAATSTPQPTKKAAVAKPKIVSWVTPCTPIPEKKPLKDLDISGKVGLVITTEESSYEIRGTTEGEVFYQLVNCTPYNEDESAWAITESNLNFTYAYESRENQVCNITIPVVGVNSSVIYPKWDASKSKEPALPAKWDKMMAALREHENGHIAIAKDYGQKFLLYLNDLSKSGECVPSEQYLIDKLNTTAKEMDKANKAYDIRTGHGKTQGVEFNV